MVPLDRWGCREHWHALPNHLRAWIGRSYRQGFESGRHPLPSYLDAHRAALDWIREQQTEARADHEAKR
ncbi:hypothetical protein [Caballeronia sp. BR00000012568055]|uniref:hypothetical protein n=1 Tax=Caballeronia sp. BR00000012568055 TaxID=2918761 RepID=UPI0023F8728A|nr:hypothetical protein [Caballeronia sp. BR00000012568055]